MRAYLGFSFYTKNIMEIFKKIKGYEYYHISNLGYVIGNI